MLQDCPSLIQPQASFTRKNSMSEEMASVGDGNTNKLEVEASSILIGFANQDSVIEDLMDSRRKSMNYSVFFHHPLTIKDSTMLFVGNNKQQPISIKGTKVTLPIKTYHNLHLQKKREQPDPIQLLAAAASVIDEGRYKGRFYERREIKLQTRPSSLKKSPNLRHQAKTSGASTFDRQQDTPETEVMNESQTEGTHTFSWQYMSMRQNPRIKRNAMHAYITYMIYTDLTHENSKSDSKQPRYKDSSQPITTASQATTMQPQSNGWHTNVQPYRMLSRQQQDLSVAPNGPVIGRPLTDFLFEQRTSSPSNNMLLPPPYERPIYSD